jgi:cytochrome c-type biogenesis protein CcmF
MNLGQVSVYVAFVASLCAAFFFYRDAVAKGQTHHKINTPGKKFSIRLFYVALTAGLLSALMLFYLLLFHQFQYSYVARYSSNTQPLLYLISAFWAGQEGTFLLWACLTAVMGWVFLKTSKQEDEYAMSVVNAYIAFLYLLMIIKSPFEVTSVIPADGAGMNPLLQDPWMAVHPPILFIGYAATIFPFALVVSGLKRRNYGHWFASGFSWTLFAAMMLGAGIIIGGFWAYEVLGWGGYWGWDPVENSSLVPWLALLALIHGLLVQKSKGSLARTNIFLALISFVVVLYATYLTRSGVLSDFSVHSFVDLGITPYLIGVMVASTVLGFGLFALRFRDIRSPKIDISNFNREIALVLSLAVLCVGMIFTAVGMSSPILTGLIGKASQVDTSFYNKVNTPVAIVIALLLGVTPFLGWAEEKTSVFIKKLSMPLALTALSCVIAYVAGVNSVILMIFVGSAAFGLISNLIITFRLYRNGWWSLGGPIAHIGVGLLLIGIIGSGNFDNTTQVVLRSGEPQSVYGYQFTFKGIADQHQAKQSIQLEVSDGKSSFTASPKLYFSENNQGMMREPAIKIYPFHDLYISPVELKSSEAAHKHDAMYELTKGETKDIGGYHITFARFDMGQHGQPGAMTVGAVLSVDAGGKQEEIIPQLMFNQRGEREFKPAELPFAKKSGYENAKVQIALNAINVEERKVVLELLNNVTPSLGGEMPQLILEISTKPLMMVVWTGVVLVIMGTAVSFRRRIEISEK